MHQSPTQFHALFLSQDGPLADAVLLYLRQQRFILDETPFIDTAQEWMVERRYDIMLSGSERIEDEHLAFLRSLRTGNSTTPALVMAREGSRADARRAADAGASEIVIPPKEEAILGALRRIVADIVGSTEHDAGLPTVDIPLIGTSAAMQAVRDAVELVCSSRNATLIRGEGGTGKETIARAIHLHSSRRDQPFVSLNCAALPPENVESELFGHDHTTIEGSFQGKAGCIDIANGGTLFIDEIDELHPDLQAKLLSAIELRSFHRAGGVETVRADVRLVAATSKDVESALAAGTLRKDLSMRFSVIEIVLPPLRERPEDVAPLVDHFLREFSAKYATTRPMISGQAQELLASFAWPGNVRQLRNVIERCVLHASGRSIACEDLLPFIAQQQLAEQAVVIPVGMTLAEAERLLIERNLAAFTHNKSRTSRILGVSRKTLHNKLVAYRKNRTFEGREGGAGAVDVP